MYGRIYNFSAGPAVMPLPVVEQASKDLLNFRDTGIGVMEMSHRSSDFKQIIETAEQNLRELLNISDKYAVIFTTGGASNQFSMVPMNLVQVGQTADYIVTGSWAKKAHQEATRFVETNVAATSKDKDFSYIPTEVTTSSNSAYLHFASNNTIVGTQFQTEPEAGDAVLVCDASSDLLHKPLDITKYGLIYAGAQKNVGPAGVTIVIVRKDLLERSPDNLPVMMNYNTYVDGGSLYNTAPTYPIYVVGEVLKWLKNLGGLSAMEKLNREKAAVLYEVLDSNDFYKPFAEKNSRSLMNVTFNLSSEELEAKFIKEATAAGLNGLKGHRSIGGIRASIYNAFPKEGVEALVEFMQAFAKANG